MEEIDKDESPAKWMHAHQLRVMLDELNKTSSPRAESLLFTNYVEMLIKDFMALVLDTKKAKDIRRDLIVEILESKEIIDMDLSKDIKLIFQIRDQLAHNIDWISLQVRLNKIFSQMWIVQQKSTLVKDWNKKDYSEKVFHVADWAMTVLLQKYENYYLSHRTENS